MDSEEYWKALVNMSLNRLLILRALHRGPIHGYAILQEVSQFTRGCCVPTYGNIYPVLKELETGGFCSSKRQIVDGRGRKVHKLTQKGEEAYQVALDVWNEVLPYLNKIACDRDIMMIGDKNGNGGEE